MARFWRKLALLAKIETVYGTDPTPTGADNAILAIDATYTPIEGQEVSRDLLTPYLGNQGIILTGTYGRLEFSVECAGSGAAGTAPAYGPLLRACGFAEVVDAGVDVEYAPVSAAFESVTLWYNRDGVKHALVGARGNVTIEFTPSGIPRWRFNFIGLTGTAAADTALPTTDFSDFITPVPVSKANTTFALHSLTTGPTERLSIDLGNQVEPRMLINYEACHIVDRRSSGSAVMEAALLATKNWDAIARGHTTGTMAVVHGTAAGNIVQIGAPKVQIGRYTEGQTQGIMNNTLPLMFLPDEGDDELLITVK
ncbi:MAG: hypothetical protein KF810_02925 [Rhizobiaceae bacterium]|nr:hypothetical protein [Rhizobiaceae bacterium]